MRPLVLLALLPALAGAAGPLQIVNPIVSQSEGGAPDPPGFEHVAGETLYLSCRISGYAKTEDSQVHLSYSVQPFDPKGVPLAELFGNGISEELTSQDKEWMPKIETSLVIPPLVLPGTYRIVVKVEDQVAKASAELSVPFQVRGREVALSDVLVIRNFRLFRGEDETRPLAKPVYHAGESLWARFDITGFKLAENNRVDVSYVFSVLSADGRVLYTQPEPAMEQSESFYPKRYVPAEFSLNLQRSVHPGEYTLAVQVKDAVGKQSYQAKYGFTVE